MSRLSVSEQQLLLTIGLAGEQKIVADKKSLEQIAKTEMFMLLDWTDAFDGLADKGFLIKKRQEYFLTEAGHARREEVKEEPYWPHVYDEYFTRAKDSKTHAAFCECVYGNDLCQHGMMDMEQLEKLMDVLDLDESSRVLELGCGNGLVTEYISDRTGAHIFGIDLSRVGIEQAQQRTEQKRHRLDFQLSDINNINSSTGSFDTLVAIDTIYWADAKRVIEQAKTIVRRTGQIAIFYTLFMGPDDAQESLNPERTPLAQVLTECGLRFTTWDFCKTEYAHWQKKLDVLVDLRQEFLGEGNGWLYNFRLHEAAWVVDAKKRRSRYLYHVLV